MAASSLYIVAAREGDAESVAQTARRLGLPTTVGEYKPTTLAAVERLQPSVVVIDVAALPGGGEVLCRQLTRLARPPLLLAIAADHSGATAALHVGAAVGLIHPVDPSWLAAQIASLLRLSKAKGTTGPTDGPIVVHGLKIDPGRCEASIDGQSIALTPTEFRILASVARSPGLVVSAHDLAEEALGLHLQDREAMDLLKVHVYRLRRKLGQQGADPCVMRNVRGFGYMLERRAAAKAPPAAARRSARASQQRSA